MSIGREVIIYEHSAMFTVQTFCQSLHVILTQIFFYDFLLARINLKLRCVPALIASHPYFEPSFYGLLGHILLDWDVPLKFNRRFIYRQIFTGCSASKKIFDRWSKNGRTLYRLSNFALFGSSMLSLRCKFPRIHANLLHDMCRQIYWSRKASEFA